MRNRRLGGPNNNLMPNGKLGIPTPTRDCVLSWNDFLTHVVGKTYIAIYGIKNHEELFEQKSFKFKVRWTFNGTFVNRAGSYWDVTKQPAPACDFFNGNFQRVDSTTASWRALETGTFLTANRRDYLISDNPSEYLIFHICYDPSQNVANKCPVSGTLLVVRDRRPNVDVNPVDGIPDGDLELTNTDWASIDRKSRSCIGESLVNTDALGLEWFWKGPECRAP
ncbi:uncharacterized protein LOC127868855 [Dreissena polymorpha]|uniref:uncharacterized protein LOC127868855 n=1 Tax=Dreissena polymorpha TaxID=45954 RepID=UPI00226482B9|nr:uncharacterized protein LOC127868855 [Dreissena polymorpha]